MIKIVSYIKKLLFAPLFLTALFITLNLFLSFTKSTDFIFSLDLSTFYQLLGLITAILITALFFVTFCVLAQSLELVIPVIFISGLIPFLQLPIPQALVFAIILFIFLLLNYLNIKKTLTDYLDFKPSKLFSPQIKQLAGFLIILLLVNFYITINTQIKLKGFEIPSSLIDTALKFTPQTNLPVEGIKNQKITQFPTITPEQLELLKKNPELLKQYGIDPSILSNIPSPKPSDKTTVPENQSTELLKPLIKTQLQKMIDPYLNYLPLLLTLLLLLTLNSFLSLLGLFVPIFVWIIFYILEATKFITFTTETRQVKKLVI